MKKLNLLLLFFALACIAQAQNTETYYLSKALGAGCGSGNILMESVKKITLTTTKEGATVKLKSLACTNEIKMFALPPNHDNEVATYFYRDKQIALILYKDNTIALANRSISTDPLIINTTGATDKKKAKTLKDKLGITYEGDFSDKRLSSIIKANEVAAEAKAAKENLIDFPDMGFKDTKGVSGVYHLSKPIKIANNPSRYTNKLQVEYLPNDQDNIIMYGPLEQKRKGLCQSKKYQVEESVLSWHFKYPYFEDGVIDTELTILIEPGVLFIGTIFTSLYEEKGQVNYEKLNAEVSKHFVIAKDKNRLNELINNPSKLSKLYLDFWARKKGSREANQMKNNPLPSENTAMRNFRAKALTAMKARAKKDRWKSTIEAAYVEETEWTIVKHNLTGRILYRQIGCVMIEKLNGKCKWRRFSIKQQYNGSGYTNTPSCNNYSTGYYYAIDCGAASKFK